ncbi:MAG TPA: adenylate/guanylate cyclase domain-containing protein [Bradyrhizobium sp.]
MDARLERKLLALAVVVAAGVISSIAVPIALGYLTPIGIAVGASYGLLLSLSLGGITLFVMQGPMRGWLAGLPFTADVAVRSAIYAAIIIPTEFFQVGALILGQHYPPSMKAFWVAMIYSLVCAILFNLAIGVIGLIGGRTFRNFISGRYHSPVEESRFVLFVDIVGSTALAERLGGAGIHRLLDRIFRLLTVAVEDYRGEVLNYVGDGMIITWPERRGAVDCRPLRCFVAMREELARASSQLQREFGVAPQIRGSLHFGTVIIGEIGDVKRAIVFNGDVMNTAARLEELSRTVEGGFLASRAAMERFNSAPPFAVRDLGRLTIRGRTDGIDVVGIDAPAPA